MKKIAINLAALALVGCASLPDGVAMTDEERAACAASKDCTVWSEQELQMLARRAFLEGTRHRPRSPGL